jgi:hypothetical protein
MSEQSRRLTPATDTSERRALLLHLGSVLELLSDLHELDCGDKTLSEIFDVDAITDHPLIECSACQITVNEFVGKTLHAFCMWPQWLIDENLDHHAFVSSVSTNLFANNPRGWNDYAERLQKHIPWFC